MDNRFFSMAGLTIMSLTCSVGAQNLPPPYATPSVYRSPRIVPRPADAKFYVPAGFSVELYAEGFEQPRFMTTGPSGELLVTDSALSKPGSSGSVYLFTAPTQRKKLIANLNRPYGLAFWRNYLFVAEAESVKRYPYDSKSFSVGSGQEVVSLKGQGDFHWTRTLLVDPRGEKLYLAIGSGSNNSIGEDPRRATICRFNPDGSDFEVFASGLRNPVGLRWYPGTSTLWATVQERDELGDELVPDFFTHVQERGFYGWPYAYIGPHEDPVNSGVGLLKRLVRHPQALTQSINVSDLVKSTITPDVLLGGHVAVLDALFYTGSQFPLEYRGGAFMAFHGSSNRSRHVGHSIAFVPFKDGKPSGPARDFLTGWMLSPDQDEVWGRPVGLAQLPDGSLLISDDGGKKIWRVTYRHAVSHP
jgi:glucose/arabinose dehydrogenase